ncbi:putative transcription factor [Iris pallida]|uniref:Transcription factor n=1 Tax=Iris pallida TaxID=29817 RepID=A0AAX6G2X3_IRIPA|nr:putative transcription factor [Iris pallida]
MIVIMSQVSSNLRKILVPFASPCKKTSTYLKFYQLPDGREYYVIKQSRLHVNTSNMSVLARVASIYTGYGFAFNVCRYLNTCKIWASM